MIPSFDPEFWRRVSWSVFSLALIAFVCLGLAEQGARGGGLQIPPSSPLSFERHRVFGLDLSQMSSLQAREWLQAAGSPSLAFAILPVDADVVQSLTVDETREDALTAIDSIRQAAGNSPLAVCLRRPEDVVGGVEIATTAITAMTERFPSQVVAVSACDSDANPSWQESIDEAARPDAEVRSSGNALLPVAGGNVIQLEHVNGSNQLTADQFRLRASGSYAMFTFDAAEPLSPATVSDAAEALSDSSHAALILVRPTGTADPAALVSSFANVVLAGDSLPEGFSGISASAIRVDDGWQRSSVGTVSYLRSTTPTAALAAEFVGTDVYLMGLESPDSGIVQVWIDPTSPTEQPLAIIDLSSFQARDAAIPVASGLPATRHEIILQAINDEGQSVTISGLFVTGTPATAWTGTMAAAVVLLAGIVALSQRCYATVTTIRRRSGPPRRRTRPGNPRVFSRDR